MALENCTSGSGGIGKLIFNSCCAGIIQYILNTDSARRGLDSLLNFERYDFSSNPFKVETKSAGVVSECIKLKPLGKVMVFLVMTGALVGVGFLLNQNYDVDKPDCRCSKYRYNDFKKSLWFSLTAAVLYALLNNKPVQSSLGQEFISGDSSASQLNCRRTTLYGWLVLMGLVFLSVCLCFNLVALIPNS